MYETIGILISGATLMSIVILTNRNPGNIYLVNRISKRYNVSAKVILETKPRNNTDKYDFWLKKIKRYGLLKTFNKYLFVKAQSRYHSGNSIIKKYFHPNSNSISYDYETDEFLTYDINSEAVTDFISSKKPDLIVVCGSNLIKPHIFNIPPLGTINIHCGITPDYRCANPVEWAVYNKDLKKIGVTIHFIDEGLDTGNIIAQKTTSVEKGDTIKSLYCKNIVNGGELMLKAISDILKGTCRSIPQNLSLGHHYLSIEFGFFQNYKVNRILENI